MITNVKNLVFTGLHQVEPPKVELVQTLHKPNINVYPDGRVTEAGAAIFLGFAQKTLSTWRYLRKGPPYVKCGSRVFYYIDELEEWAKNETIRCSHKNNKPWLK